MSAVCHSFLYSLCFVTLCYSCFPLPFMFPLPPLFSVCSVSVSFLQCLPVSPVSHPQLPFLYYLFFLIRLYLLFYPLSFLSPLSPLFFLCNLSVSLHSFLFSLTNNFLSSIPFVYTVFIISCLSFPLSCHRFCLSFQCPVCPPFLCVCVCRMPLVSLTPKVLSSMWFASSLSIISSLLLCPFLSSLSPFISVCNLFVLFPFLIHWFPSLPGAFPLFPLLPRSLLFFFFFLIFLFPFPFLVSLPASLFSVHCVRFFPLIYRLPFFLDILPLSISFLLFALLPHSLFLLFFHTPYLNGVFLFPIPFLPPFSPLTLPIDHVWRHHTHLQFTHLHSPSLMLSS